MNYIRTLKRIRQRKTNYHKRSAVLLSRSPFITIKISNQNVASQLVKPTLTGDFIITSVHSRNLTNLGWKGSLNNLPACYLTGFLLARKSLKTGIDKAILYIGKDVFTSRIAACVKGMIDGGIKIPVSEESLPEENRIKGSHIVEYANILKSDDDRYKTIFSGLLKNGLEPEKYESHFEEIKNKIHDEFNNNSISNTDRMVDINE